VNFAGPFYRSGRAVLEACIAAGKVSYLDICDDADATLELLELHPAAQRAGVRALVGMGSSPGVTNVLVRAAVDALGSVDTVDIAWIVDVEDVGNAAIQHFWHIFGLVDGAGCRQPVARWEELSRRQVLFPDPVGERMVLELSHPEPLTVPRFLPVDRVRNFGGVAPEDALVVCWALARLGADAGQTISIDGKSHPVTNLASALYERYREERRPARYLGSGLVIDVHTNGNGYRFESGDSTTMEEATGTPAAAGILLLLAGEGPASGVFAPECLDPARFFPTLGQVSRSTGSLKVWRLVGGMPTERLRVRELIATRAPA
jgi:saccharopine dehydrogenase-like NADP-dependent oxidoreductase